jgi:uncharacterized protein YkwD
MRAQPIRWRRLGQGLAVAFVVFAAQSEQVESLPGAEARIRAAQLIGAARAQARMCGDKQMAPAGPVVWDDRLWRAARAHGKWLQEAGAFTHDGPPGAERVSDRVNTTGYRWRGVAENLAMGFKTPESSIDGWLESPSHCSALMNASYVDFGLAWLPETPSNELSASLPAGATVRHLWVLVMGQPRERRAAGN